MLITISDLDGWTVVLQREKTGFWTRYGLFLHFIGATRFGILPQRFVANILFASLRPVANEMQALR